MEPTALNPLNQFKPEPLRFLLFSASLRSGSLNTKLITLAGGLIEKNGGIVDLASIKEFDAPFFDQDVEDKGGFPDGIKEFQKRLLASDALIISSPEYNSSMPGCLKNIIDWTSRFRPQPFNERQVLLMSASPSLVGGNRGLWTLRIPFEHLGARVYPDMFSLAAAHKAFTPEGKLDTVLEQRFEDNIAAFMSLAESAKHYPCIKKAWVEFLGEKPDAAVDRVDITRQ